MSRLPFFWFFTESRGNTYNEISVGAAAGCDLLDLDLQQSPVRSLQQPLQGNACTTKQRGRALARLAVVLRCTPPREAAHGHGWPIAAGPRSRTGARACRAWARHRTTGAKAFGCLALFQVTRCKSGTIGGRYRRNGYVHNQQSTPAMRPPSPASRLLQVSVFPRDCEKNLFLPSDFAITVEVARCAFPDSGLKELARFLQVPLISP